MDASDVSQSYIPSTFDAESNEIDQNNLNVDADGCPIQNYNRNQTESQNADLTSDSITNSNALNNHQDFLMDNASNTPPFICKFCGKSYHFKHHLKVSLIIHLLLVFSEFNNNNVPFSETCENTYQ